MHAIRVTGVNFRRAHFATSAILRSFSRVCEFLSHPRDECLGIQTRKALQQILVAQAHFRHRRHLEKNVEVVRHQAVRQNPATRKIFIHPHVHPKRFAFPLPKHESPVHHPRDAVIYRRFPRHLLSDPFCTHPRCLYQPSRLTHLNTIPPQTKI